jgi:hypothetical protein
MKTYAAVLSTAQLCIEVKPSTTQLSNILHNTTAHVHSMLLPLFLQLSSYCC